MDESKYFKKEIRPVIGEVLEGPYMGVKFALFGKKEIEKYFQYSRVVYAAKDQRRVYRKCTFKFATWKEAAPYSDKLTYELLMTLNKH